MIYLQRSRDKEDKKFRRSIYVGILFICIAVYFTFYGFHPLRSAALYIASPFWRMSSGIGNYIESGAGYFISKESLRAENMALKKEVFSANLKLLSENALLEENVKLKALLGREDKEKSFMATVLARPPMGRLAARLSTCISLVKCKSNHITSKPLAMATPGQPYEL